MRIIDEEQLDFDDVLIQPKRSTLRSRSEVDVFRTFTPDFIKNVDKNDETYVSHTIKCVPIIAANMGTCGIPSVARVLVKNGMMCAMEKHLSYEELDALFADLSREESNRIALSIGVTEDLELLHRIDTKFGLNIINIDIANGHCPLLIERVKQVRKEFPFAWIIAGTVVTADITQDLIMAGANIVRCNIGSGSVCTTRLKTGVGRPVLSTIVECADAAHQMHAFVMSDGGCKVNGDICKSFCAGADFIMTGSMFAGTDESAGDIVERNGKKFKPYYGMSSRLAQEKHFNGMAKYRASEGREVLIPYKGPIQNIVEDILGSIRSCCTYIGSHCIKHMSKHATFYKVRRQLNTMFENCEHI